MIPTSPHIKESDFYKFLLFSPFLHYLILAIQRSKISMNRQVSEMNIRLGQYILLSNF